MKKSKYVSAIEREEVREDDPIKCFFPTWVGSTFWVIEGVMAIEISQNKEISGGGKMEGEKKLVLLSFEEEQIGEHKH